MFKLLKAKFDKKEKRERGTIDHFLPGFIIIVVAFMLYLMYVDVASVITIRDNADMLTREYVLRMESTGWLDGASAQNLVTQLEGLSSGSFVVENVKISGSVEQYNTSIVTSGVPGPVGYANPITLTITGDIIDTKNDTQALGIHIFSSDYKLSVSKQSTAKY